MLVIADRVCNAEKSGLWQCDVTALFTSREQGRGWIEFGEARVIKIRPSKSTTTYSYAILAKVPVLRIFHEFSHPLPPLNKGDG